jgi:hypothetical protein
MEDGGGTGGRGGRRRRWCGRGGGISGAGAADPAGRGHGQGRLLRAVLHPQAEPAEFELKVVSILLHALRFSRIEPVKLYH